MSTVFYYLSILCLSPTAGITDKYIKTCIGGAIGFERDDTIGFEGSLSGGHCEKFGFGNAGKCLKIDLPKREARNSFKYTIGAQK
jgi:hypothetical protein